MPKRAEREGIMKGFHWWSLALMLLLALLLAALPVSTSEIVLF